MREFDLVRGNGILDDSTCEELLQDIDRREFDVNIVTPPCDTHSRARDAWRTHPGPRPLRFYRWPLGFPWLEGKQFEECRNADRMVEQTWEIIRRGSAAGSFFFTEHPEDLGATVEGERPVAIWQDSVAAEIQAETGAVTWALFQCEKGADSSKPARMLSDLAAAKSLSILVGLEESTPFSH